MANEALKCILELEINLNTNHQHLLARHQVQILIMTNTNAFCEAFICDAQGEKDSPQCCTLTASLHVK